MEFIFGNFGNNLPVKGNRSSPPPFTTCPVIAGITNARRIMDFILQIINEETTVCLGTAYYEVYFTMRRYDLYITLIFSLDLFSHLFKPRPTVR